jgi:hypothetical protein
MREVAVEVLVIGPVAAMLNRHASTPFTYTTAPSSTRPTRYQVNSDTAARVTVLRK